MTPGAMSADTLSLRSIPLTELRGGDQLLQSEFWGAFKAAAGWTPRAFVWETASALKGDDSAAGGRFLILERRFPGGLRMAYVPYGPLFPASMEPPVLSSLLHSLSRELRKHLSKSCFLIRYDLCGGSSGLVGSEISPAAFLSKPLNRAPYRVQPPDTVILPLENSDGTSLDDDALQGGMHKKTRYNIRLALKKGVEIRRFSAEEALAKLPDWYQIYRETGERDCISLHSESYYRRLFEMSETDSDAGPGFSLYMASHDGDDLAGIIVSRQGGRSVYMYGASSSHKRELMPNHLIQWKAIQDARDEGAGEYDFFGIPPADDPSHPMHGLWRFKTGFGGNIHHYFGAWDYACSAPVYRLYAMAEKIRGRLAALRKKGR